MIKSRQMNKLFPTFGKRFVYNYDNGNAVSIQGIEVTTTPPSDSNILQYNSSTGIWETTDNQRLSGDFTDGDLSAGVLTITHTLGNFVAPYIVTDNTGAAVAPDSVTYSSNSIAVDLSSQGSLTGTWNYAFGGSGSTASVCVIEQRTSDYSTDAENTGKTWIRTDAAEATIKCVVKYGEGALGSWSAGGDLGATNYSLASCGTLSSGLCFGGNNGSITDSTQEYDGSSWSAGGNMTTARKELAGTGGQTSALSIGGDTGSRSNVTEEYNGTSWSSGGNITAATDLLAACGTLLAGLMFGGNSGSATNVTEEYNGTSWSSGGNLNTTRQRLGGSGTQVSGLSFGGSNGPVSNVTEEYNGTSWSSGGNLNTARDFLCGFGVLSSSISCGGYSGGSLNTVEKYDGSSWSVDTTLTTARSYNSGFGSVTAGATTGGLDSSLNPLASTEEYTGFEITYAVKTFTLS